MNIAIVSVGSKCRYLMDFIWNHQFHVFSPKIIGFADVNNDAVGMAEAKKRDLLATNDYNDFFTRDDIDLIIELTGNIDVYNDIQVKKNKKIPPLSIQK